MGTCEFCGIDSSINRDKNSFRRHFDSHHPTPQQCSKCKQTFGTSKLLEWHRKSVHSTSIVKCPCCGKTFKSKTAMIMHQKEKEFKKTCQICNTEFQNPRSYARHWERPLECVLDFNTKNI